MPFLLRPFSGNLYKQALVKSVFIGGVTHSFDSGGGKQFTRPKFSVV